MLVACNDILCAICNHLGHIQELAKLSAVCKHTRQYLTKTDMGGHHWAKLASGMGCSMLLQTTKKKTYHHHYDAGSSSSQRLLAKMTICPWVLKPVYVAPFARNQDDGITWKCTRIIQWVLIKNRMHIRCRLDDTKNGKRCDSGGLIVSTLNGNVVSLFETMDEFEDLEHSWSPGMERVYDTLLSEGYIPAWLNEMDAKQAYVRILPIHERTLVVAILDQSNPVLHFFHVDSAIDDDGTNKKTLRFVRTIYVPDLCIATGNSVCVSEQQQIWVAIRDGSFRVWGFHASASPDTSILKKPQDMLYPLFCVLEDENFVKALALFGDRERLRANCNLRIPHYHSNGTLLHAAVTSNYQHIVQMVLQAGGDPNLANDAVSFPFYCCTSIPHNI